MREMQRCNFQGNVPQRSYCQALMMSYSPGLGQQTCTFVDNGDQLALESDGCQGVRPAQLKEVPAELYRSPKSCRLLFSRGEQ